LACFAAAASIVAACERRTDTTGEEGAVDAIEAPAEGDRAAGAGDVTDYAAIAAAAVADERRPAADRADDERRKPAEALAFMEAGPGMTVFEMEAGAGWYTELLSHAVGPSGTVIMQNPQGFLSFVGDKVQLRLEGGRLGNVRQSISNFDTLEAADGSVDLVAWVQGPHELYYHPQEGVSLGDPVKAYAEIHRVLKPGGAFVVIDHSAESGAPETTGNDLHRIDKVIVMQMADQAGFTLAAESNFLANPQDPLTIGVFDPSIRGQTDQFALRFRKD
jgi:predicted methyltransferase